LLSEQGGETKDKSTSKTRKKIVVAGIAAIVVRNTLRTRRKDDSRHNRTDEGLAEGERGRGIEKSSQLRKDISL